MPIQWTERGCPLADSRPGKPVRYVASMGGLKPWHLGILGCSCLVAAVVIIGIVYLIKAVNRR